MIVLTVVILVVVLFVVVLGTWTGLYTFYQENIVNIVSRSIRRIVKGGRYEGDRGMKEWRGGIRNDRTWGGGERWRGLGMERLKGRNEWEEIWRDGRVEREGAY